MKTRVALGMSSTAIVASMGAIALSATTNAHRLNDIRAITRNAQTVSHHACVRSRRLAPPLLEFFASFNGTEHALTPAVLAEYRKTVPKSCP